MVFYLRIAFWAAVLSIFAAFLHYTLPQWDTVRVTDVYEKRVNPGSNAMFWGRGDAGSNAAATERDVFFIQTMRPGGSPMVYRNEDAGWGWPPMFKFDSSNLQAEAADARSQSGEAERWVAIKHYGWRFEWLSIYPNALAVKPVDGPDARVIPWKSLGFLLLIVLTLWAITSRVLRFSRRYISPVLDRADGVVDGWWHRLRGRG